MSKIEQEMNKIAKDLSLLSKSQAKQKAELKRLFTILLTSNPADLKKSVSKLSPEQQETLKSILLKSTEEDYSGDAVKQPKPYLNFDEVPRDNPVYDDEDEDLMDFSQDRVKHQGDNEAEGFDGQSVEDYEVDSKGLYKNPGQEKGRLKGEDLGEYEPSKILHAENKIKPKKEQELDEEEQQDGKHKTLLPIKNKDIALNEKVRSEFKNKKNLDKGLKTNREEVNDVAPQQGPMGSASFMTGKSENQEKKKLLNNHENFEDHDHIVEKSKVDWVNHAQEDMLDDQQIEQEMNKYRNFEDQKSNWHNEVAKKEKPMQSQNKKPVTKSMENVEYPSKLDPEEKQKEENKYLDFKDQKHPKLAQQYKNMENMYHEVKKAMQNLEKAHLGFKKLSGEIQHKEGYSKDRADAIAAAVGRKKYGKKEFQHMAAEGKKSLDVNEEPKSNSSVEDNNGIKRNTSLRASEKMSKEMPMEKNKMCKCEQCMKSQNIKQQMKKHEDDIAHAKEMLKLLSHEVGHELEEAGEKKELHKAKEDYEGEEPKKVFDKEKNALVLKSEDIAEKIKQIKDPNERQEAWAKHWGYDWKLKPLAKTKSGKMIFVNADPKDEEFNSKDHIEAANILKRMKDRMDKGQSEVKMGGMEMSKELEEAIKHHEKQLKLKKNIEEKLNKQLEKDLAEPKQDREDHSVHMEKSNKKVIWAQKPQTQLDCTYKSGRNAHYNTEDLIAAAAISGHMLKKTRWTGTQENGQEQLKKSEKASLNDIIEKRLDLSPDDLRKASDLLKAKPMGAFTVKSFEEKELIDTLNLSDEISKKLLNSK